MSAPLTEQQQEFVEEAAMCFPSFWLDQDAFDAYWHEYNPCSDSEAGDIAENALDSLLWNHGYRTEEEIDAAIKLVEDNHKLI